MLEVNDLAKRYGPVVALDGATFTARLPVRVPASLAPGSAVAYIDAKASLPK